MAVRAVVIGAGADFNALEGRGGPTGIFPAPPAYWPLGVHSYTLSYAPTAQYFASFRTRVGFAVDRTLFYLTGGVASGGARSPATLVLNGGSAGNIFTAEMSQSSRMKYVLGAGLEYAFADTWSARLEYFFLSQSLNTQLFDNGSRFQYLTRTRNENSILRFGLNYNLGPHYEATGYARQVRTKRRPTRATKGEIQRARAIDRRRARISKVPRAIQRKKQLYPQRTGERRLDN